jgi:hypothetical protein
MLCAAIACQPGQGSSDEDEDRDPSSAACDVMPGNYLVTYAAASDDCGGVDDLPDDRFTVSAEGEILTAAGRPPGAGSAPSGCFDDDASMAGCVVSFTRECSSATDLGTATVLGDYELDFDRETGSVSIDIALVDGSTLLQSCKASQQARISHR